MEPSRFLNFSQTVIDSSDPQSSHLLARLLIDGQPRAFSGFVALTLWKRRVPAEYFVMKVGIENERNGWKLWGSLGISEYPSGKNRREDTELCVEGIL